MKPYWVIFIFGRGGYYNLGNDGVSPCHSDPKVRRFASRAKAEFFQRSALSQFDTVICYDYDERTETSQWVANVNRLAQTLDDYAESHDISQYPESHNYNVLARAYVVACRQSCEEAPK